jgi:acyl-CoA synthetase (NDP forming)
MSLSRLFSPVHLLVTGSSANPNKVGHMIAKNIINSGYEGEFSQLNPTTNTILNRPVSKSFLDIHKPIDVDIISIPAAFVKDHLLAWGRHKQDLQYDEETTYAVIISAGFGESGSNQQELDLIDIARQYNIRVIGPNCLGVIANHTGTLSYNGSFTHTPSIKGNIALLSQSGALISSIMDVIEARNVGFQSIVSLGNQSDLNMYDFLEYHLQNDEVKVIGVYAEALTKGEQLHELLKTGTKPVVILKAGKSKSSQEAAASHTGSLAGDFDIARMYIEDSGAIFTNSYQEFVSSLYTFGTKFARE